MKKAEVRSQKPEASPEGEETEVRSQKTSPEGEETEAGSPEEAEAGPKKRGTTSRRGFGGMDPAKQKALASMGGRAAHAKGTAHVFTTDEARAAGHLGGTAVSRNKKHMQEIGRQGGLVSRYGYGLNK